MTAQSRWLRVGVAVFIAALMILAGGDRAAVGVAAGDQPIIAPPLKVLVTNQSNLSVPDRLAFGVEAINNAGTWVDAAGSGSALVLRRLGDPTLTRLLQAGDPVPGIPLSAIDLVGNVRINQSGLVCALVWTYRETTDYAIVVHDGAALRKIAASSDIAPDSAGSVFGRSLALVGLNDWGDVAFTAPMTPLGWPTTLPVHTTVFIAPGGGAPVRIVGPGDTVPGTSDGSTLDQISGAQFNNRREVLFRAAIAGGYGYFVARRNDDGTIDVRKVVASGDPDLRGGTFDAALNTNGVQFNDAGEVAMVISGRGLYISSPEHGLSLILRSGGPMPGPLTGKTQASFATLQASFNVAGSVAFAVTVNGLPGSPNAVLRYVPGPGVEVLAYAGETAPVASGQAFGSFSNLVMNSSGDVVFYSAFAPSTPVSGGLFKSSAGALAPVVLDDEAAPTSVGGTYRNPSYARLLDDGTVYFESDLQNSQSAYGAFLARPSTPPGIQVVASDAEHVPSGSRIVFRDLFLGGAGTHTMFEARRTGAWLSLWTHDAATGVTSRVAAVADPAPPPVGGWLSGVAGVGNHGVMDNGDVVFSGTVLGRTGTYLFSWSPTAGVSKLVGPGDVPTGTTATFTSCWFTALLVAPFNEDTVVFRANLDDGSNGIFLVPKAGGPIAKIVRSTDPAPGGGTFTDTSSSTTIASPHINRPGQVAFWAPTSTGASGIFIGTAGAAPTKVAATGDTAPGGGTFSAFVQTGPAGFNDLGQVIFFATVSGGASGLFLGKADGTVQAIASNGEAAPDGGTYAFDGSSKDARTNARGDVLFRAPLMADGGAIGSGLFLRRFDTHVIETVALEGQPAPGTSFPFGLIAQTINNYPGENYALGPTGEVLFYTPVDRGDKYVLGIYRYHGPGTLEQVLMRGEAPPDGEGGAMVGISQSPGAGSEGMFFLRLASVNGSYRDGIYLLDTLPPVLNAAVQPAVLWPANSKPRVVTVSGLATDSGSGVGGTQGTFEVIDEYGLVHPRGTFTVGADGTFFFDVTLEARRLGTDFDGRRYVVRVTVCDVTGNRTTASVSVVVPHNVGK